MIENQTLNYAVALQHYNQNGRDRWMRKFCEYEG